MSFAQLYASLWCNTSEPPLNRHLQHFGPYNHQKLAKPPLKVSKTISVTMQSGVKQASSYSNTLQSSKLVNSKSAKQRACKQYKSKSSHTVSAACVAIYACHFHDRLAHNHGSLDVLSE